MVDLAPHASITYAVTANILSTATGTLVNSATVQAASGTTEADSASNTATDDDTELTPTVDLQITKTDGLTLAVPGSTQLTYTIVVTNAGPSFAKGAFVVDDFPSDLINVEYTSVVTAGAGGNTQN